jgi:hypothetical protein
MNANQSRNTVVAFAKRITDFLRWLVRQLPLLGGLADCTWQDHKAAAKEFLFAFSFSTLTFWVSVLIMSVLALYSTTSTANLILKTVSNGELLIFSVSFAGPILMIAMQDRSGKSPFPGAIWHVAALWFFAVAASVIFGLLKVQVLAPNVNLGLDMEAVRNGSYYIFALSLVLRYTTMVYQKMLAAADASGPKQDKAFADRWAAHAKSQGR